MFSCDAQARQHRITEAKAAADKKKPTKTRASDAAAADADDAKDAPVYIEDMVVETESAIASITRTYTHPIRVIAAEDFMSIELRQGSIHAITSDQKREYDDHEWNSDADTITS